MLSDLPIILTLLPLLQDGVHDGGRRFTITHKIILVLFNVHILTVYELICCICHSSWGDYRRFNILSTALSQVGKSALGGRKSKRAILPCENKAKR